MKLSDRIYDAMYVHLEVNESGYVSGQQDATNLIEKLSKEFAKGFYKWLDKEKEEHPLSLSGRTFDELVEIYDEFSKTV
jgi:hypothetical protein